MDAVATARLLLPWLGAALVAVPLPLRAEETIRCESHGMGYRYCPVDTGDRVELVRDHGIFDCKENRSWGYDRHGVWVDHGCKGEFRVGRSHGGRDKAMVGALVGLAALAAIASSRHKQEQTQDEVASWAIGTFSGYDSTERSQVEVTVLPGGSVRGRAGSNAFTGSFKGTRLEAGRYTFRVERSGNGFVATDERDAGHRVTFQRSGSGY